MATKNVGGRKRLPITRAKQKSGLAFTYKLGQKIGYPRMEIDPPKGTLCFQTDPRLCNGELFA